jgi:chromate transporter
VLGVLIGVEFQRIALALGDVYAEDFILEAAGLLRSFGLLLGSGGEFVLLLAAFYRSFGEEPYVREVFNGISAGAAGLMFATGVKLALSQPRVAWVLILIAAAFVLVGPLRLPLIAVLAALAPIAIAVAAWAARRGRVS